MSFEEFQHGPRGSHLGYQNGRILAILNLYVTVMPLCLSDVTILDIGTEHFSNSESLCSSYASHQLSAQSDMVWEETSFEEFQEGRRGRHLRYRNRKILAFLNLCVTVMSPIKFWLNPTNGLGGDVV